MEELKKLNIERGYVKGTLTRLKNFVSNELDVNSSSLEALLTKREKLLSSFHEYEQYNKLILHETSSDTEDVGEVEANYFHCLTVLNQSIKLKSDKRPDPPPVEPGNSNMGLPHTKLPSINIPCFSGKYSEYVTFIELYKSVIHNDKAMDNVQKLYYLRSFLKSEPYDLVKNLPLTSKSYHEALDLLERRYYNKYKIVGEHVNSLLDLDKLPKFTNANDLRNFVSVVRQTLAALKNLDMEVDKWDPLLLGILLRKLDPYTARAYQLERDQQEEASVEGFLAFLDRRALATENADQRGEQHQPRQQFSGTAKPKVVLTAAAKEPVPCIYCKCTDHKLFKCPKFKLLAVKDRLLFVKKASLCNTCLNSHKRKCKYYFRCSQCKKDHNTLLHDDENNAIVLTAGLSNDVLIPTARVKLYSKDGREVQVKAILDSGSQVSLITTKAIEVLGLTPERNDVNLIGVTENKNKLSYCIPLQVHSLVSPFNTQINCHVVQTITCQLPQKQINLDMINIPSDITLADTTFHKPSEINMLIGADVFFQLILPPEEEQPACSDLREQRLSSWPAILNTKLGHVIAGALTSQLFKNQVVSLACIKCETDISEHIKAFWQTESVSEFLVESEPEQQLAESIFTKSVKLQNNKFQVDLPLKLELDKINENLGNSFDLALHRFHSLEKRLHKNVNLLTEYQKFIDEYLKLGHGHYVDITSYNLNEDPVYFMPHFAVINESSKSTRTRVVFDASMKTTKKISLNDILLNGPVVQKDLFNIILLFRFGEHTFTTDIRRMFRNVLVNPEHTSLQNILWRDHPAKPIECIRLDTVTYGVKTSSYLATRCLLELAQQYESNMPLASFILKNCTYVDDILFSCSNVHELIEAKRQLCEICSFGSFKLHKWSSNTPECLANIPSEDQQFDEVDLQKGDLNMKALGLKLDVKNDCFIITSPEPFNKKLITKREILSYISKFYDPMGFASPIVIKAKSVMQKLWSQNVDWDACPSLEIINEWLEFTDNLAAMEPINLGRCIPVNSETAEVQLVGFADASSTTGYGCCIYLRIVNNSGRAVLHLLCSKSRVNPLNNSLTIPRLELNAALLLAILIERVYNALKDKIIINNVYLFTDSKITLAWIYTEITRLQAYVSNRVSVIQQKTNRWRWLYIRSQDNPADLISRGISPQELPTCSLWWEGPKFLHNTYSFDNFSNIDLPSNIPELKPNKTVPEAVVLLVSKEVDFLKFLDKYSRIDKATRILAYIIRFCHNIKNSKNKKTGEALDPHELQNALHLIIKREQSTHFSNELAALQKGGAVQGALKSLHPFIDSEGLIRVGGRLDNSDIPLAQKHPIILPKHSRITELIIQYEHVRLLHAGPKSLLSNLNQKYWLINGIRQVKKVTHRCLVCFRFKASAAKQLMGSLPQQRVTACRAFQRVGIDFAGPVQVKNSRIRKPLVGKGYVCIYVCFVTKATHLELTSDISTEAFLACFKRFIARRGLPSDIYCDNGGCFRGAGGQLAELYKLHNSGDHQTLVQAYAAKEGIRFHFTPSYSPVFAGLAEAAVKSMKFHLKRIVLNSILTYEQLHTILCQIEAILNSRPILPLSEDINDYCYLTPGHFLVGTALTSYPEPDCSDIVSNRLGFWQQCVKMQQSFWKAWHMYYLNSLQHRGKWHKSLPNIKIGDLVLIREPNAPPLVWPMARVVDVFPGKDGRVRAFQLKTANGKVYRRSLQCISVLPFDK